MSCSWRNRDGCDAKIKFDVEEMFDIMERQGEEGVDFNDHPRGADRDGARACAAAEARHRHRQPRGSFLAAYMASRNCENPFYEHFDRVRHCAASRREDISCIMGPVDASAIAPAAAVAEAQGDVEFLQILRTRSKCS